MSPCSRNLKKWRTLSLKQRRERFKLKPPPLQNSAGTHADLYRRALNLWGQYEIYVENSENRKIRRKSWRTNFLVKPLSQFLALTVPSIPVVTKQVCSSWKPCIRSKC